MTRYAVARLDEIEELTDGREPFRPVRHHFGITSFGVTPGRPPKRETGSSTSTTNPSPTPTRSCTSLCAAGHVRARRRPGACARRNAHLCASRREADGICRGARDDGHRARRHAGKGVRGRRLGTLGSAESALRVGQYAEAADRGRQLVEAHPQYAGLLYNLACCESLAGRTADAVDHLKRAIDHSERSRSYAKDDSDFDPIRDEPAFKELIGR